MDAIARACTHLQVFDIVHQNFTAFGVISIVQHCSELSVLRLQPDYLSPLSSEAIIAIVCLSCNLCELDVSGSSLNDQGALGLATKCPLLTKLVTLDCKKLTASGIFTLLDHCHHLKELHLPLHEDVGATLAYILLQKQYHHVAFHRGNEDDDDTD